jgi:sialidase-1
VLDHDTGEIFLFTRGPYVVSSKDNGQTWSEPRSLSDSLPGDWKALTSGTGNSATQFRLGKYKGRLVASLYGSNVVTLIFSDDHGRTWQPGAFHVADKNGEPSITELSDGRLLVSPRHRNNKLGRLFLISEDGGVSFSEKRYEPAIPIAGQGEIVAAEPLDIAGKGTVRPIICCGPAKNKTMLTFMVSLDDCKTWPISRVIDEGAAANLALVALPKGKVGVLYEAEKYHRLRFQCVDLGQVINDANLG